MPKIRTYSAALLAVTIHSFVALGQALPADASSAPSIPWHSDSVVYVAGLDDLKQNTSGSLSITANDLVFSTHGAQQQIPLRQISSVSVGDERVATGGTSAKVARKIFLFGVGAAAGAVTSKTVDVLTVEFLDVQSGYHGAVFEVPKSQAEIAHQQLTAFASLNHQEMNVTHCDQPAQSRALLVERIDEKDLQLPPEYRVLLYEQLITELRRSYIGGTVLRVGDQAAGCPAETLHISVRAFKKGNEKLRSSTGPVGLFVGGTSVAFSAQLIDRAGAVVFEKNLKSSKHGDSDSLGVTHDLAVSVSKRLAKSKASGFKNAV